MYRSTRTNTALWFSLSLLLMLLTAWGAPPAAHNFSVGETDARLYGVHEIELTGDDSVDNPFDTAATVTFTAPSGHATTVNMFYDGDSTWRARVYVAETGAWTWTSASADDDQLNGRNGAFTAAESDLRGMLKPHPDNPRQWITEDGQWFLNLNDTAYRLFNADEPLWQEYLHDNVEMGITSVRAGSLGGWGWLQDDPSGNYPWDGDDFSRYNLDKFKTTDERLQWMLDTYPDLYLQMILFGQIDWQSDEVGQAWAEIPQAMREDTMRYMIARWAAFPQIFWLAINDISCTPDFPNTYAMGAEIGRFVAENDPFGHLMSVSPTRQMAFCYLSDDDLEWVSYIHLQDAFAFGAELVKQYVDYPLHIFLGEDYYEQGSDSRYPRQPAYAQRWLFWSWLLSGASANYGGRYPVIQPYKTSGDVPFNFADMDWDALQGLDSVPYITAYFTDRDIDLSAFTVDDTLVGDLDGRNDDRRPELVRRAGDEFIVYHPNALEVNRFADTAPRVTPGVWLDLRDTPGLFSVEWYRPADGLAEDGGSVVGGNYAELISPWQGQDFVLRLVRVGDEAAPTDSPLDDGRVRDGLQALYTFDEGVGSVIHDTAGAGRPVNLHMIDPDDVIWGEGVLTIDRQTEITTREPDSLLTDALQAANAITLEAWITPASADQNGPARIVTLSTDQNRRNFTLGQGDGRTAGDVYNVRLRTTTTTDNGQPSLTTPGQAVTAELTHVVYTRDVDGTARIYVNGQEVVSGTVSGDFSNWGDGAYLALANELSGGRPWLGTYHLLAIYTRALSPAEIAQNFAAGAD